jgi:hypothetical protein
VTVRNLYVSDIKNEQCTQHARNIGNKAVESLYEGPMTLLHARYIMQSIGGP